MQILFDRGHVRLCVERTWMPEVVKYGISNLTLIGGFPSLSSASTLGRPKWARIKYSFPPWDKSWHKRLKTKTKFWKKFCFYKHKHTETENKTWQESDITFCNHVYDTHESWFLLTGKDLIDQTISLFSGTHFTLPTVVLNFGESASVGTGMWISTLLAVERLLNWLFAWDTKQAGQV